MKKNTFIYKVFLLTFFLSIIFSTITNLIAYNTNQIVMFVILVLILVVSIIFDMIATSALTSNEASFHAKNTKKVKGAKETIYLIKNNVKVVSICSDVIGDISGIVSGALGAVFAINLASTSGYNIAAVSILVAAFISAFTVGGKALFKEVAVKNSDKIIFMVGKFYYLVKFKK